MVVKVSEQTCTANHWVAATLQMTVPSEGWARLESSAIQLRYKDQLNPNCMNQSWVPVSVDAKSSVLSVLALRWTHLSYLRWPDFHCLYSERGSQMPGIYSPVEQNKHCVRMLLLRRRGSERWVDQSVHSRLTVHALCSRCGPHNCPVPPLFP